MNLNSLGKEIECKMFIFLHCIHVTHIFWTELCCVNRKTFYLLPVEHKTLNYKFFTKSPYKYIADL